MKKLLTYLYLLMYLPICFTSFIIGAILSPMMTGLAAGIAFGQVTTDRIHKKHETNKEDK